MSRRRKPQGRSKPRGAQWQQQARPAAAPAASTVRRRPPVSGRRRPQPSRRSWWPLPALPILIALTAGVVVAVVFAVRSSPSAAPGGSALAPISTSVTGQPIDGIQCNAGEQLLFHIHAHLAVYVDGTPRTVPEGIGIMPPRTEVSTASGPVVTAGTCFYWLHAHTADGIIHIESPVQRTYTLGNYFDIWGIPLDSSHVGPASGSVIAYLNGQRFNGDVRSIPLDAHNLVQLDVNGDVAPVSFTFPAGL